MVGDDFQAIYSFRHTSPENMIHFFEKMEVDGTELSLTENRRSREEITEMGAALAKEGIPWVMKNPLLLIDNSRVKAAISLGMAFYEPEATKGYFDYLVARYDGKLTGQLDAEQLEMEVDFL